MSTEKTFFETVKWDDQALVTCVVQDAQDKEVLMVAYMNKESLEITLKEKRACFWSRSRKKLWRKGEESGNVQMVKKITIDCDGDCLLIFVEQIGGAACHTGMRTCFYRRTEDSGKLIEEGKKIFDPSAVYKK